MVCRGLSMKLDLARFRSRSTGSRWRSFAVSDRRPLLWLVDDSATERAIILAALGDRYRYAQFGDGSEVVELLGSGANRPDAILLDWVMPGMSGDDVCRYVRSLAHAADLPIIVVTSSRVE